MLISIKSKNFIAAAMQANVMSMNPQQINMANMVAMQGRPNTGMFTPAAAAQTPTTVSLYFMLSC
jgi:hypothetical protein